MGALIIALVPILQGLLAGSAASAVLGGLTVAQWAMIAGAIANLAAPEIEDAMKPQVEKAIRQLHPMLDRLWADAVLFGPEKAAQNAAGVTWPT